MAAPTDTTRRANANNGEPTVLVMPPKHGHLGRAAARQLLGVAGCGAAAGSRPP